MGNSLVARPIGKGSAFIQTVSGMAKVEQNVYTLINIRRQIYGMLVRITAYISILSLLTNIMTHSPAEEPAKLTGKHPTAIMPSLQCQADSPASGHKPQT